MGQQKRRLGGHQPHVGDQLESQADKLREVQCSAVVRVSSLKELRWIAGVGLLGGQRVLGLEGKGGR